MASRTVTHGRLSPHNHLEAPRGPVGGFRPGRKGEPLPRPEEEVAPSPLGHAVKDGVEFALPEGVAEAVKACVEGLEEGPSVGESGESGDVLHEDEFGAQVGHVVEVDQEESVPGISSPPVPPHLREALARGASDKNSELPWF